MPRRFDTDAYNVAEDLYVMVIGPEGRWGTVPAKAFLDSFGNANNEVWLEVNREVVSQGLAVDYALIRESDGDETTQFKPDERRTMRLIYRIPQEQWEEVSRETENILIEDPDTDAELEYRRVTKITYEMVSDGIVDYPAGQRPRSTITLNPPPIN